MGKYRKWMIPALVFAAFGIIALFLSWYILSLPLAEITSEECNGFSSYQLGNCIAYYQRIGDVAILQRNARIALFLLWAALFAGAACSFSVFPRISLSRRWKGNMLVSGFLGALLIAGLPLVFFTDLVSNGFIFALSLLIGFLTLELTLVSSTKETISIEEFILSMSDIDI